MSTFCDLNLITKHNDVFLLDKIRASLELGYRIIALSQIVDFSDLGDAGNDLTRTGEGGELILESNLNSSIQYLKEGGNAKKKLKGTGPGQHGKKIAKENMIPGPISLNMNSIEEMIDKSPILANKCKSVQILQRVTFIISDVDHIRFIKSPRTQKFDLVAICPINQKLFVTCCESVSEIDIITIDFQLNQAKMTEKSDRFKIKRSNIRSASARNLTFEFNYTPAIYDSNYRKLLIGRLGTMLSIEPRIKNCMFSSGAERELDIRGPYDVANLASLFGFRLNRCRALNTTVPSNVIKHAQNRKFNKYGVQVYDRTITKHVQDKIIGNESKISKKVIFDVDHQSGNECFSKTLTETFKANEELVEGTIAITGGSTQDIGEEEVLIEPTVIINHLSKEFILADLLAEEKYMEDLLVQQASLPKKNE